MSGTPVVVAGALANKPLNGGEAWVRLSWILGLRRLGFDVHFVEQIERSDCRDRLGAPVEFERSVNRAYFDEVLTRFGLEGRATLICTEGGRPVAGDVDRIRELGGGAQGLFNLSGHLRLADLLPRSNRIYVDLDPGFTQFWHAEGADLGLSRHDRFLTVGTNIGRPGCAIPVDGVEWLPTLPPTLLEEWATPSDPPTRSLFTTVARWRAAHGPVEFGGQSFGLKHHELRRIWDLPGEAEGDFEIALDIDPTDEADRAALVERGWRLVDPRTAAGDPDSFRDYVRRSGAELSVAQGAYVGTRSGWFSDRTACYLAAGRPAIVQDTGWERRSRMPGGLLPFATRADAVAALASVGADYEGHADAARELARTELDSDLVLGAIAERVGLQA